MLTGLTIAFFPAIVFARRERQPGTEANSWYFTLFDPIFYEINNQIPGVMRHPAAGQIFPRLFLFYELLNELGEHFVFSLQLLLKCLDSCLFLILLPGCFYKRKGTGRLGDPGFAFNLSTGDASLFVVADIGPQNAKLGEISIALAEGIGGEELSSI